MLPHMRGVRPRTRALGLYPAATKAVTISSMARPPTPPPSPDPITVCVVEDHDQLRGTLVRLLSDQGFDVLAAVGTIRDGERAISLQPPDVAVVDQQLPDGLGIDLCRRLSSTNPAVICLLYTAVATEQLAREARRRGGHRSDRQGNSSGRPAERHPQPRRGGLLRATSGAVRLDGWLGAPLGVVGS